MAKPTVIHHPTSQESAQPGAFPSYAEVLAVLNRALFDNAAMVEIRRIASALRPAALASDWAAIQAVAREIASGRMRLVSHPHYDPKPAPAPAKKLAAGNSNLGDAIVADRKFRQLVEKAEGRVAWMYLDTHKPHALVTVGVGRMLPSAAAAQALPFQRADGSRATAAEIKAEYDTIYALPGSKPAAFYRPYAKLSLTDPVIDQLLTDDLTAGEAHARHLLKGFDTYPYPAKLALTDMAFNMGEGRAKKPGEAREHGLYSFHTLRAAAEAGDWEKAAASCNRPQVQPDRNAWTKANFLEAAKEAPKAPSPHRAASFG